MSSPVLRALTWAICIIVVGICLLYLFAPMFAVIAGLLLVLMFADYAPLVLAGVALLILIELVDRRMHRQDSLPRVPRRRARRHHRAALRYRGPGAPCL